jgi:hypothetical protein
VFGFGEWFMGDLGVIIRADGIEIYQRSAYDSMRLTSACHGGHGSAGLETWVNLGFIRSLQLLIQFE